MALQILRISSRTCKPTLQKSAPLGTTSNVSCTASSPTPAPSRLFRTSASSSSANPNPQPKNPSLPSFNLFKEVRNARPAVRYTVYAGLGLMATVESTFWFNVIKAKFLPSTSNEDKEDAERFLAGIREAVAGYKATWMGNYGRYYGGYVWGVGER